MKRKQIMMRGQRSRCYISGNYNPFPVSSPVFSVQTQQRAAARKADLKASVKEDVKQ